MATPEKKKPAAAKIKKANAASENETTEEMPQEVNREKKDKDKKPAESTETRKRPKPVKEVVAAKKPKSKLVPAKTFIQAFDSTILS